MRITRNLATGALATLLGFAAGCSDDGGDPEAFCATAQRFEADNPAAVFERFDPADPAGTAALLRDAALRLSEWSADAPGDIGGDLRTLAGGATGLAAEFENQVDPAVGETSEYHRVVEPEAIAEASGRVLEYTRTECGVDLDPAVPPVSSG